MKNKVNSIIKNNNFYEKSIISFLKEDLQKCKSKKNSLLSYSLISFILGIILSLTLNSVIYLIVLILISIVLFEISRHIKIKKKISKIGFFTIPISHYKFNDKSIWVDRSGLMESKNFNYPNIEEKLIEEVDKKFIDLKNLVQRFPLVLSPKVSNQIPKEFKIFNKKEVNIYSEEIELCKTTNFFDDIFKQTSTYNVNLPVIKSDAKLISYLSQNPEHKEININPLEKLNHDDIKRNISKIEGIVYNQSLNKDKTRSDIDAIAKEILSFLKKIKLRFDFIIQTSEHINVTSAEDLSYTFHSTSYNFYCPSCNEESLKKFKALDYLYKGSESDYENEHYRFSKNTLMKMVDFELKLWKCPLCEKEYKDNEVIKVHKMLDEIFYPVFNKLHQENYKDRLNIYNHAWTEMRKYEEKLENQMHQVRRDSRTKEDNIKSKIRDIEASINADEYAITLLQTLLVKYKKLSNERADEIRTSINSIKKEIKEENDRINKEVDIFIAESQNYISKVCNDYMTLERRDQQERDLLLRQQLEYQAMTMENTSKISHDVNKMREIQEVQAHWSGMDKKPFLGILGDSAREKAKKRMLKN